MLLEALPYIRRFHGETFVIKYGGHAMVAPALKDSFAQDICLLKYIGVNVIIVHGGGPQATKLQEQLGQKAVKVAGRRVTDEATLDVMKMVVAGKLNVDLSAALLRAGARPIGLNGASSIGTGQTRARSSRTRKARASRAICRSAGVRQKWPNGSSTISHWPQPSAIWRLPPRPEWTS